MDGSGRGMNNLIAAASFFSGALFAALFGGTRFASVTVCFLKGTRIWTPKGEIKVEDLRIKDRVVTFSGEAKPIKFIGRQRVRWTKENAPVRVAQSALGPNNPHRDLYLSKWHSLYIDGVLIPIAALLNGHTIARCQTEQAEIEYFSIKLERHDVIFADGAACETILGRSVTHCDNFEEYRGLYGEPCNEPAAAPMLYNSGRSIIESHLRSAISPFIDVRTKPEIVRDNLVERAAAHAQS